MAQRQKPSFECPNCLCTHYQVALIPPSGLARSAPRFVVWCAPLFSTKTRPRAAGHTNRGTRRKSHESLGRPSELRSVLRAPSREGNSDGPEEDAFHDNRTGADDLDHQSQACGSENGEQTRHTLCRAYVYPGRSRARLRP